MQQWAGANRVGVGVGEAGQGGGERAHCWWWCQSHLFLDFHRWSIQDQFVVIPLMRCCTRKGRPCFFSFWGNCDFDKTLEIAKKLNYILLWTMYVIRHSVTLLRMFRGKDITRVSSITVWTKSCKLWQTQFSCKICTGADEFLMGQWKTLQFRILAND